jgi:hypothetical protein
MVSDSVIHVNGTPVLICASEGKKVLSDRVELDRQLARAHRADG